ncbi:21290_t:CDS:2, partial [Gigaspora rosea]
DTRAAPEVQDYKCSSAPELNGNSYGAVDLKQALINFGIVNLDLSAKVLNN